MHAACKKPLATLAVAISCLAVVDAERAIGEDEPAGQNEKRVVVDKTKFSDLYPAVWFSPSTGEIAALKQRSEIPPAAKYEVWIEPRDPEFDFGSAAKRANVGFQRLGQGQKAFRAAVPPDAPALSGDLDRLMADLDASEMPVFYCKGKNSECIIMITTFDKEEEVIAFQWRGLSQRE